MFKKSSLGVAAALCSLVTAASASALSVTVNDALAAATAPGEGKAPAAYLPFEFGFSEDGTTLTPFNNIAQVPGNGNGGFLGLNSTTISNPYNVPAVFFASGDGSAVALHPGESTDVYISFIAPTSGLYSFSGAFTSGDSGTTNVTSPVGSATLSGSSLTIDSTPIFVAAGDRVTFIVNNVGNYSNDTVNLTTNLAVTSVVPTPSAAMGGALLAGGLSASRLLSRRRA